MDSNGRTFTCKNHWDQTMLQLCPRRHSMWWQAGPGSWFRTSLRSFGLGAPGKRHEKMLDRYGKDLTWTTSVHISDARFMHLWEFQMLGTCPWPPMACTSLSIQPKWCEVALDVAGLRDLFKGSGIEWCVYIMVFLARYVYIYIYLSIFIHIYIYIYMCVCACRYTSRILPQNGLNFAIFNGQNDQPLGHKPIEWNTPLGVIRIGSWKMTHTSLKSHNRTLGGFVSPHFFQTNPSHRFPSLSSTTLG